MNLKKLIRSNSEFLKSEFNLTPTESTYHIHPFDGWGIFCNYTGTNPDAEGVFFPRRLEAHLLEPNKFFEITFFHEFFGHGLFCEYSKIGRELVLLEKRLEGLEKKVLGSQEDPAKTKITIDENNPYFKQYLEKKEQVQGFYEANVKLYEGFALWMEHFLAKKNNKKAFFEERYERQDFIIWKKVLEDILKFEDEFGSHAVIYSCGLPKKYNKEIVLDLLKRIYKDSFEKINLAVLYGSKKPYSDIDLFVVTEDRTRNVCNDWIDIYQVNKNEFIRMINLLDISVTDPIFSGDELISTGYNLTRFQKQVLNTPITQESIKYNLMRAKEQEDTVKNPYLSSRDKKVWAGYIKTYRINAQELGKGRKILTLNNIKKELNLII